MFIFNELIFLFYLSTYWQGFCLFDVEINILLTI